MAESRGFRADITSLHKSSFEDSVREEISLRLKEKSLDYRTKVVEEAISPLIDEVTALSEYNLCDTNSSTRRKKSGRQKLSKLIQLVDKATRNFLAVGEEIAHENPDFQEELLLSCDDVKTNGEGMQKAANEFSKDPCDSNKHSAMMDSSKRLLLSVTRLMVVADMVDVNMLLEASSRVQEKLKALQVATSEADLMTKIMECSADIKYITQRAAVRQNDGRSEASLQLVSAAQMSLNQASRMLTGVSMAFLQFPELRSVKANHEYVITRMLDSLKMIALLADGDNSLAIDDELNPGELAMCFKQLEENLDETISMAATIPISSSPQAMMHLVDLQNGMNKILTAAAKLAGSSFTHGYRQHTIITQCGELKTKMNELLSVIEGTEVLPTQDRERAIGDLVTDVGVKVSGLKKEIHRATLEHVADIFTSTLGPLMFMCRAAQQGDVKLVEERAEQFREHANSLLKVASSCYSLSEDPKCGKSVKMASKNVYTLLPQVINAALTLARRPSSHVAKKNMSVFKETWAENISRLTESVDAISSLTEFMFALETRICEDAQQFLISVETRDTQILEQTVRLIRGRCKRLCHVVKRELKQNESHYTQDQIRQSNGAMEKLVMKFMASFCELAAKADQTPHMIDDQTRPNFEYLEEALQKVVDNVRNVRRSILVARAPKDLEDMESDLEDMFHPPRPITPTPSLLSQISVGSSSAIPGSLSTPRKFQQTPRHSSVFEMEDTTKGMMAQLPAEQQEHLAKVTESLAAQQAVFEDEINKWDDSRNDIVMLSKEMCIMMMDMSDFTRGIGPLHSTMDVIITAKDIVRAATTLDGLARSIADSCPDDQCRKDIHAYLDQINLYSHQLNITANVKADLKSSTSDAVENASMLITTSRNLMTAVVYTVKTCYIASTAIARIHGGAISDQFVQWRLTLPRKKKLYGTEVSDLDKTAQAPDLSTQSGGCAPIIQLGQFKSSLALPRESQTATYSSQLAYK